MYNHSDRSPSPAVPSNGYTLEVLLDRVVNMSGSNDSPVLSEPTKQSMTAVLMKIVINVIKHTPQTTYVSCHWFSKEFTSGYSGKNYFRIV